MIEPMLSQPGRMQHLVATEEMLYEPKLDGIRALLYKKDNTLRLINRKGRDITKNYPELLLPEAIDCTDCILDGEIIVYNSKGNPDFHLLLSRDQLTNPDQIRKMSEQVPAVFVAFDLLRINGKDVTALKLKERKKRLDTLLPNVGRLQKMYYTDEGVQLWDFIMARQLEGVMAKRSNSPYLPGKRTDHWLKIKNFKTQDCIIVGFSSGKRTLSSLGLAAYVNDRLRFLGKVGTGFSEAFLSSLYEKLKEIEVQTPPVKVPARYKDMRWVQPVLACEVQYLEFGSEGMMRNPSFLRMRPDKPLKDCILEVQPKKRKVSRRMPDYLKVG